MNKKKLHDLQRNFLLVFGVLTFAFVIYMLLPYHQALVAAVLFAILLRPLQLWLEKKVKSKNGATAIILTGGTLLFLVPVFFLIRQFLQEAFVAYISFRQKFLSGRIFESNCTEGYFCSIFQQIDSFLKEPETLYYVQEYSDKLQSLMLNYTSDVVFGLPDFFVGLTIFYFLVFYLLRDTPNYIAFFRRIIPLDKAHTTKFFRKINGTVYGILYGQFLTALIQGALGGLLFFILGIDNPVFWGAIMVFLSILPLGAGVVWVPYSIHLILKGLSWSENIFIIQGVVLFCVGLFFISTIDNVIRPMLIGSKAHVHFLVIIIGVFGGLKLMGFLGLFVGPLLITIVLTLLEIFQDITQIDKLKEKSALSKTSKD